MSSSVPAALRSLRTRLPPLTRQAALGHWARCASWDEARALMGRLVPWHRTDAWVDLVAHVPGCWPELVPTAVARGPEVTRALLRRSDCTETIAQQLVHHLPRQIPCGLWWGSTVVYDVLTEIGGRGWSLVTLDTPRWRALVDEFLADRCPVPPTMAWKLILSTPDVPSADWAALLRRPTTPGYTITPPLFRRLLADTRLTADDRRRLVSNSLLMEYTWAIRPILWDSLPWRLPGALAGILDVEGYPARDPDRASSFLDAVWRELAGRHPAYRAAFWEVLAAADSLGRPAVVDALWAAHRDELLAMDEALAPLLLLSGTRTRLDVLLATAQPHPAPTLVPAAPIDPGSARCPSAAPHAPTPRRLSTV